MANYGVRISQDGYDVKTCSDKETIITSKYANFKGSISGSGTKTVTEGAEATETIAHGLSYIPSVTMFVDVYDDGKYKPAPFYDQGRLFEQYYYAYADSTNVYLVFFAQFFTGGTWDYDYAYKIYIDKGKLT